MDPIKGKSIASTIAAKRPMQGLKKMAPDQGGVGTDSADNLQRIVGHAIVDHIMQKRGEAEKLAHGGMVEDAMVGDVNADEEGDFLAGNDPEEMSDDSDNTLDPESDDEDDEQKKGKVDLRNIMSSLRRRGRS